MKKHEWVRMAGYWECKHCNSTRRPLHKLSKRKGWMYYYASGAEAGWNPDKIKCIERPEKEGGEDEKMGN